MLLCYNNNKVGCNLFICCLSFDYLCQHRFNRLKPQHTHTHTHLYSLKGSSSGQHQISDNIDNWLQLLYFLYAHFLFVKQATNKKKCYSRVCLTVRDPVPNNPVFQIVMNFDSSLGNIMKYFILLIIIYIIIFFGRSFKKSSCKYNLQNFLTYLFKLLKII